MPLPDRGTRILRQDADASLPRWEAPPVEGASIEGLLTPARLEAIAEQAKAEGFAAGRQEGMAAARADLEARVERLDAIMEALARPLAGAEAELSDSVVTLVRALTRQLVRREFQNQPEHVIGVVREALQALPVGTRDIRLHLHPEDAALIRERLQPTDAGRAWTIREDPVLMRGDCQVTSETSQVDARLETRLGRLISDLLGDDREQPGPE